MVMMDQTGEECKKHLETLVGDIDDEKVVFWPHKHKIVVNDSDVFHRIAQSKGKSKLIYSGGEFYYYIRVPDENTIQTSWTVVMDVDRSSDFGAQYRKLYQVVNL